MSFIGCYAQQSVISSIVAVTSYYADLEKPAGATAWDSGAISLESIPVDQDFEATCVVADISRVLTFGIVTAANKDSFIDAGAVSISSLRIAWRRQNSTQAGVYSNGASKGAVNWSNGSVLKITRESNALKMYMDDVEFSYTNPQQSDGSEMYLAVGFNFQNSRLNEIQLDGTGGTWDETVNITEIPRS